MKMVYDNYIFDLYGTLIDIHTDEERKGLWQEMADYLKENFSSFYTGATLRKRYIEICHEEEELLRSQNGHEWPEIRIEKVWARLVSEGLKALVNMNKQEDGKKTECSKAQKFGNDKQYSNNKKDISTISSPENSAKIRDLCIFFRESSRDKFIVYDGVKETLEKLQGMGKKIFLLSNAQRAFTEKELSDAGLTDYFDDIFISSDKEIKKPQKEFLELLVSKNRLSIDKCVMIGNDIFSDVGVAAKNGMNSIFLNTYDFSEKKIDEEIKKLGIKGSCLTPLIIGDGDIRKILR